MITIPFHHNLEVTVEKIIENCDESQLNELILLADKKLNQLAEERAIQLAQEVQFIIEKE